MKKVKFLLVAIFCVSMMMLALNASATIYLDENFDKAQVFYNNNFTGDTATTPTFAIQNQGINVKAERLGNPSDPAATTFTMTSAQVSRTNERYFSGPYSCKLTGNATSATLSVIGTPLKPITGGWQQMGPNRMWQLAIGTNKASAEQPAGTRLGHFSILYSTAGTTAKLPNAALGLVFLSNSKKTVDVICTTTLNATTYKVGEIRGYAGSWGLITIVQQPNADGNSQPWVLPAANNVSPVTYSYRGPQPTVPNPAMGTDSNWGQMPTGYSIFMNSNQQAVVLTRTELGSKWGNTGTQASPVDFGWELVAENNNVLYVDDMLWANFRNNPGAADGANVVEVGTRCKAFNAPTEESGVAAAGPSWMLY